MAFPDCPQAAETRWAAVPADLTLPVYTCSRISAHTFPEVGLPSLRDTSFKILRYTTKLPSKKHSPTDTPANRASEFPLLCFVGYWYFLFQWHWSYCHPQTFNLFFFFSFFKVKFTRNQIHPSYWTVLWNLTNSCNHTTINPIKIKNSPITPKIHTCPFVVNPSPTPRPWLSLICFLFLQFCLFQIAL